jgi:polar amino acid transport system substrate-binding protein
MTGTKWVLALALLAIGTTGALSQGSSNAPTGTQMTSIVAPDVLKDLAPTGKLRAAINLGNTVLAQKDSATGEPRGITVDLARELGKRLGVAVELVPFDAAGKVFEALKVGAWDVAFLAIEPVRAAEIAFTAPYVIIEGAYAVPVASPIQAVADVDRDGVRIAVGKGSAYDLFLTRTLKHAKLVRSDTSAAAPALMLSGQVEVVAGVKQPLAEFVKKTPSTRMIDGRFMAIEQAMGTPRGRDAGARYLRPFIEEMKSSGFVAKALERSNQPDAAVAPAASN